MHTGDIVFFKGESLISKIISKLTKSPYTHVAVVIMNEVILESDRFIETRLRPLHDDEIYTIMRCELNSAQKEMIIANSINFIGKKYDYLQIAKWFFKLTFNFDGKGLVNNANRVYCSELVDILFKSVGIDLLPDKQDGDVLPSDLLKSPLLRKL